MATQVAKKRFIPNTPVKAGVLYKVVVNGKDYIVKAKYNKTLATFNAMWFDNIYPKQYFFTSSQFAAFDGVLMPLDEIIVDGNSIVNENIGAISNEELNDLFSSYNYGFPSILVGQEDHRTFKFDIYPWQNKNSEETKYYQIDDFGYTKILYVVDIQKAQTFIFEVKDTFVPVRAVSATTHRFTVDFTGYSVTYQGISPTSTTATTCIYSIPNSLATRKLTVTPSGVASLILKFE